jgi:hypothetical protein
MTLIRHDLPDKNQRQSAQSVLSEFQKKLTKIN